MTRRHHPLLNQEFEVLKADKSNIILRVLDGSALKMPRAWTDAEGTKGAHMISASSVFTLESLRELIELVDLVQNRR